MYKFARAIFYFIFTFLCRWKVTGRDYLPQSGPVVIVCNHISNWDPIAVGVAVERQVFFMAKEQLFHIPILAAFLRMVGSFPVKRDISDRAAIKKAMEVLKKGNVLGIFPEGHRSQSGKLEKFTEGAVHLAVKYDASILPVGIIGTGRIFYKGWFHSFNVNIGQPIPVQKSGKDDLPEYLKSLNQRVREEVARLSGLEML